MKILAIPAGELLILLAALPALLSPVILMPAPEGPLPFELRLLVEICVYPRWWAILATVIAAIWIQRAQVSNWRTGLGLAIVLVAWVSATYTANTIAAFARF